MGSSIGGLVLLALITAGLYKVLLDSFLFPPPSLAAPSLGLTLRIAVHYVTIGQLEALKTSISSVVKQ